MVKFYVNMILNGRMTLDQVPARWYEAVRKELERIDAERAAQQEEEPVNEPEPEEPAGEPAQEAPADEEGQEEEAEPEEEPEQEDHAEEYAAEHDDILDEDEEE